MNDAEREELRARVRKMNKDSSGDRSGKRGFRVLVVAALSWLFPPTGRRRRRVPEPARVSPPTARSAMPRHRSPYAEQALDHRPFTVNGPLARPYLLAHERERRAQAARRIALELALDGVDVGPAVIHGVRVPRDWRLVCV